MSAAKLAHRTDPNPSPEAAPERKRRRDPKGRHTDGTSPWFTLKNQDPDRHYVWVSLETGTTNDFGVGYYEALGYERELFSVDGVQPLAGLTCKDGEVIECRGNALMSCAKEDREDIELNGPDGASGQRGADMIEKKIVSSETGIFDPLRGIHGWRSKSGQSVLTVQNATKPDVAEFV